MRIWVDADACPRTIRDLLFRAGGRVGAEVVLVANRPPPTPGLPHVRSMQVDGRFDAADRRILDLLEEGDLVITADVLLAAAAIERGARALSPRGDLFTEDNIGDRVAMRNLMDEMRSGGLPTGGPPPFGKRDRQAFANQLDRLLAARN